MAIHTSLPIYKLAYDLLQMVVKVTRNIPRDFKRLVGEKIRNECVEITLLIFRANVSRHKVPHIEKMLECLQVVELLLRLSKDMIFISPKQYAEAIEITDRIGRQASGWKKASAASPAA